MTQTVLVLASLRLLAIVGTWQVAESQDLVRVSYSEAVSSIGTLNAKAVYSMSPKVSIANFPDSRVLTHLLSGDRRRCRDQSDFSQRQDEEIVGFDGRNFWQQLGGVKDNSPLPVVGLITKESPLLLLTHPSPLGFLGADRCCPVVDIKYLLSIPATSMMSEKISGVDCVRFEWQASPSSKLDKQQKWNIVVWLDPALGYLPRRWTKDNLKGFSLSVNVERFKEIKDTSTLVVLKIPEKVIYETMTFVAKIEISDCIINSPVSDIEFAPDFPVGTQLIDRASRAKQSMTFVGGKAGQEIFLQRAAATSRDADNARPMESGEKVVASIAAEEKFWKYARWALLVVPVVVLCALVLRSVVALCRRLRRSDS